VLLLALRPAAAAVDCAAALARCSNAPSAVRGAHIREVGELLLRGCLLLLADGLLPLSRLHKLF